MIIGLRVDAAKLRTMEKEEKRQLYKKAEEHSRRLEYEAQMCVNMLQLLYGKGTALMGDVIVKEIGERRAAILYHTEHLECVGSYRGQKMYMPV